MEIKKEMSSYVSCAASFCLKKSNIKYENGQYISYHKIPSNPVIAKKWISFCKRHKNWRSKNARLCSRHFVKENFITLGYSSKPCLDPTAIPTVKNSNFKPIDLKRNSRLEERNAKKLLQELLSESANIDADGICCVPGCESNNPSTLKSGSPLKITYQFPKDEKLREKWLKSIGLNKDKKYARICIDHFKINDLIRFHTCDGRILLNKPLDRPKLKPGVVPNVFQKGQGKNYNSHTSFDNDFVVNPLEFVDINCDEAANESESYNEPQKKIFRNLESNAYMEIANSEGDLDSYFENDFDWNYEEPVESKTASSTINCPKLVDSSTQCNLYEELWMESAKKDLKSKNCRCIEDFFIYLNPRSCVRELQIINPVLQEMKDDMSAIIENNENPKTVSNEGDLTSISIKQTSKLDEFAIMEEDKEDRDEELDIPDNIYDDSDSYNYNEPEVFEEEKQQVDYTKLANGQFECKLCSKVCLTLAAIKAHAGGHLEKSTLCVKCGRTFTPRSYSASLHAYKCTGSNANAEEIAFINQSVLDIDYENLDLNYAKRLKLDKTCKVCGKYFPTTRKYFDHINVHTNRKPYKCNSCRSEFSNYANFFVHVKKFKCPFEGLVVPKYAPQGLTKGLVLAESLKVSSIKTSIKTIECRICHYIGSRDTYINHFSVDVDHLAAEEIWVKKHNITEFSCKFCKAKPFSSLIECISHSRRIHRKFPSNEFLEWYEENQWLISTTTDKSILKPSDADFCSICKLGLSEDDVGDHLCSEDHLLKEKMWLESSKILLKCTTCPKLEAFPRLYELMLHNIEVHITNPEQNTTLKDVILTMEKPLLRIVHPNKEGNIVTKQGVIFTNDVGGLEYVKETGGRYLCTLCQKTFVKRIAYFDHQVAIHKKLKPYKCSCGFESTYYESFLCHTSKNMCSIVGRMMPAYAPKTFQYHSDIQKDKSNFATLTSEETSKLIEVDDENFIVEHL